MANGYNRRFLDDPWNFIQTYTLTIKPRVFETDPDEFQGGKEEIDLVSISEIFVRIENYKKKRRLFTEKPIKAWFLPMTLDKSIQLDITDELEYVFTPDLSGCMFAAYGEFGNNITVEHVNNRTDDRKSLIRERIAEILNADHEFCKILSPLGGYTDRRITTYSTAGSCVVGLWRRIGGGWRFFFKPTPESVRQL